MVQQQRQSNRSNKVTSTVFKPYQLNKVAEFGGIKSVENGAGVNVPTFVPQFKAHFARVKTTLTDRYEAAGTSLENTKVIAAKHRDAFEDMQQVRFNGKVYDVVDVSPEQDVYLTFDYLTIRDVKKGGGAGGA